MKLRLFLSLTLAVALCFYGCEKSEIEELVIPETPTEETDPDEPTDPDDVTTDEDEDDEFFSEPGDGTWESPYTVSQALDLINSGENKAHKCYYVKGFVAKYNIMIPGWGQIFYYVTDHSLGDDDYEKEDCLYVPNGYGLGGEEVAGNGSKVDYMSEGDKIVVYGRLEESRNYNYVPCITNSQIYYLNGVTADVEEDGYDDYYGFDPMEGVYYNDFDKVTLGFDYQPLMDSDCWKNEMGSGADYVGYNYSGDTYVQHENFASGDSYFSKYDGSDGNFIRFMYGTGIYPLKNYFVIKNISLPSGVNDYKLYFGAKIDFSAGTAFSHNDFNVYISDDGNRWIELLYEFPNGDPDIDIWDLASTTFSLPSQTSELYIYFTSNLAIGYRLDDVCLMPSDTQDVSINFSTGIELPGYTGYEGDGTMESPYKVSQAADLVNSGSYDSDRIYFVKGLVAPLRSGSSSRISYYISESGYYQNEPELYISRGLYLGGEDFTGFDSLNDLDEVVVYGNPSMSDDGTPEMAEGRLYSLNDDVAEGFNEDICQYMTDSDFISYCINNFDTNKNGRISFAEAEAVVTISCSTATDFTGIEYFPNLQSFTSTSVKYVDLSDNAELTTVKMNGSPIEQLDLSNNIKVTTLGANAFDKCSYLASITLPESLTGIGNYAFRNCSSLTTITLTDGLSTIGNYVFQNCTSLASVYIPGSLESWGTLPFDGCSALAAVTLGDGLTNIGEKAFYNCTALKTVTIPSSLTKWGDYAFSKCGLETVILPEGLTVIGESAFSNCTALTSVTISSSVTEWGGYAFSECTGLKTLTLADGLTAIGEYAFYKCTALTLVEIPSSLTELSSYAFANSGLTTITLLEGMTTIGTHAFYGCESLATATIPHTITEWGTDAFYWSGVSSVTLSEGLTTIGDGAFHRCNDLTKITLPETLKKIGKRAFAMYPNTTTYDDDTGGLQSITIPDSVIEIGEYAFYGNLNLLTAHLPKNLTTLSKGIFDHCTHLTTVTLPENLTTIGTDAFYGCWQLPSITLPESLTTIESGAFDECESLKTVTLPENLTTIEGSVFAKCTSLASVSFPKNLTTIGNYAFYQCTSLASVTSKPTTPPAVGSSAFSYINTSTLYVPSESVDAYANSDWAQYFSQILPTE